MRTIVCDCGTGFIKCGYSDNETPFVFKTAIAKPLIGRRRGIGNAPLKEFYIGDEIEIAAKEVDLDIEYPIESGMIKDWVGMTRIWEYAFYNKIKLNGPAQILLTEPPLNPKANRREMAKIMFEHFGFKAVYFATQGVLALYSRGLQTGVVLDSGDGVTHIIPVFDGFTNTSTIKRLDLAGRAVTRQLSRLLSVRGYPFKNDQGLDIVQRIKEGCCYVCKDYKKEMKLSNETTVLYREIEGVSLDHERFSCSEILFDPKKTGLEERGVAEMLFSVIQESSIDLRKDLYKHIVLCGGTSMLKGFPQRLEKELRLLFLKLFNWDEKIVDGLGIKVYSSKDRKNMIFVGGVVLAEIIKDMGEASWVTEEEWKVNREKSLNKFP